MTNEFNGLYVSDLHTWRYSTVIFINKMHSGAILQFIVYTVRVRRSNRVLFFHNFGHRIAPPGC